MEKALYGTPSEMTFDGTKYTVISEDHVDQKFYHVTKEGEELCILAINEEGKWEANCDIDKDLVFKIGDLIERMAI